MNNNNYSSTKIILAVRVTSTRLASKATKQILGHSILEIAIKRLQRSKECSEVIVATTASSFEALQSIIEKTNASYYIGSEKDVLSRYVLAAKEFGVDTIVRATADNALVSILALDSIVESNKTSKADLSYYTGLPYGSGIEVIKYSALELSNRNTKDDFCREHITQYIYQNKNMFNIECLPAGQKWNMENLRTTIDTIEDYQYVKKIFEHYNDIYVDIDRIIDDIKNNRLLLD